MNPYLFIVGCRQLGTTLLRRMVDAHPEIAITRETHWISEVVARGRGIDLAGRASPRLPEVLEADPTFATLGIGREELERLADGRPSYPAFVAALFDRYGAARGKRIVGGRTPGHVQETGLLHDLFPDARFVQLVRDGRDVCLSERERYLELRYEALVSDPEGECRLLCDFLGVEFDPAMLHVTAST
jgi:hypothetical protein